VDVVVTDTACEVISLFQDDEITISNRYKIQKCQ